MVVEVQGRHVIDLETVVVVGVLIGFSFEEGPHVDCGHDVDVVVGVVGVRGLHIVNTLVPV